MHACSMRFVGKFHRDALSRHYLQLISETYTKLQEAETPPGESHRSGIGLETPCRPPLMVKTKKGGRPTRKPGRPTTFYPWTLVFLQQRQEREKAKYIQHMCARPLLPVLAQALGSVALGSRATNHASRCMMAERPNCTF